MSSTDRRAFLTGTMAGAAALALQPELFAGVPRLGAPLQVAVIGCGRQGLAILAELAKFEDVTVVGLCDPIEGRLRRGKRRAKGVEGYATHAELLEKAKPQAVFVATPTHLHRAIVEDAIAAGCHVYCEAPLAHTAEDAVAIAAAARGTQQVVQAGMAGRTNPIYKLARSFFKSGAIRDAVSMRAQHHEKNSLRVMSSDPANEAALNWKLDEAVSLGLPGEFGTHQFDVIHWFTGKYPTAVSGSGAVLAHEDGRKVADTTTCMFTFDRGVQLVWDATLGNSYAGTQEVICGTMGAMRLAWTAGWMFKEADAPTQGWEVYANRQAFHNDEGITLIADATKLAAQGKLKEGVGLPHPPVYYAVESFLKSATDGAPVACSADEGARATLVAIAAQRAVTGGGTVTIAPKDLEVGG
jgi:predicted dehydrogenase